MVYNLLGLCITLAVAVDPVYNPAGPYRVSPLIENATEEAIYPYLRQGFVWSRDALLEQAAVHGFLIVGGTVAFGDTIETNVPSTGSTPSSVFVETGSDGFLQRQAFAAFINNLKAAGLINVDALYGTGTPGKIAKFIQDATLADSIITEDTGKITIGGDTKITGFTEIQNASAAIFTANISGATITDASNQIPQDDLEYVLSELWYRLHNDVKWEYINFNNSTIDSLSDVDITGATAGKILKFNSSGVLVVSDDALGDTLSASVLDDLGDVTISGVVDQEILSYDSVSGQWINRTKAELGLDTTEDLVDDSVSAAELEPVWAGKSAGILIRSGSGQFDAITNNSSNWNTAYSWGNHATVGYITDGNTNWDNQYGFISDPNDSVSAAELEPVWAGKIGIMIHSASGTFIATPDNHAQWDTAYNNIVLSASNWTTAYTERLRWDGGATGLNASTGRTSLGLGTAATRNAEDTLTNGSNLPSGGAVIAYINGRGFMTDPNDSVQGSELDGVFSTVGLLKRTGTAAYTTVPDNSANWNTAYTERLRWDGGATGLNASTGRTSLGLGTAATRNAEDTLTNGANLPDGEAIIAYINGRQFSGPHNHGTGTANYVAKFVGSATIGNSQIYDNGTGVGVGTTVMTEKFNVNGMVYSNGLNLNGNYKISERTYTITTDSPATLLDANGSSLSIGKSYKIEAGISSTSTQTGAVAYLFGNGTYFTLYKIFEAGTSSNHVEIYLEGNTPKIRLYGNSTPYNCTVRLEEFPNRFRGYGPDMYTYTTASGVQRIVASGSDLTYGSITLTGEKGGYAGIAYKNVSGDFLGYFMVDRDAGDNVVGWYDGGWAWYFKDGILNLPQNTGHKINLDGESGKHKLSHSSQSVAIYTDRYVRFHSDTNLDAFVFDCDFGNLTIDGTYYGNGGGLSGVNADTLSGYVHTDFVKRAGDSMYGPLNMGAQKVVFDNSPTLSKLEMGADYKIGLDAYTLVLQTDRDFRIQSNDPATLFFIDGSANVSNFYTNVAMNNYNILNANKIGGKGLVFTARTESTATALMNALSDGEMVLWKPGGAPLALAVKYGPKDLRWQTLATYSESEKYPNNVYAGAISYGGQLYRVQVDDNF